MSRSHMTCLAVPVLEVRLEAIDTMHQHISPLGRMVVSAAAEEPLTMADLVSATALDVDLIQHLLGELVRQELVTLEEDGETVWVRLGRLGTEAPARMHQIDQFNQQQPMLRLERLTHQLLTDRIQIEAAPDPELVGLPAEPSPWAEGDEYDGPLPPGLLAGLPSEGMALQVSSVAEVYAVRHVYSDRLIATILGPGLQRTPPPTPGVAPAPPRKVVNVPITGGNNGAQPPHPEVAPAETSIGHATGGVVGAISGVAVSQAPAGGGLFGLFGGSVAVAGLSSGLLRGPR